MCVCVCVCTAPRLLASTNFIFCFFPFSLLFNYYNSCSIYNNLLYFATLSVLHGAPVLICPAFTATAISAIVVSSVSPERCEITVVYPFSLANWIVSNVSVKEPIWFGLINILFATFDFIPFANLSGFVTNKSSPTNWTLSP